MSSSKDIKQAQNQVDFVKRSQGSSHVTGNYADELAAVDKMRFTHADYVKLLWYDPETKDPHIVLYHDDFLTDMARHMSAGGDIREACGIDTTFGLGKKRARFFEACNFDTMLSFSKH